MLTLETVRSDKKISFVVCVVCLLLAIVVIVIAATETISMWFLIAAFVFVGIAIGTGVFSWRNLQAEARILRGESVDEV